MARKTTKPVCFACGEETDTVIQRLSSPALRRYICMFPSCWKKWYALAEGK